MKTATESGGAGNTKASRGNDPFPTSFCDDQRDLHVRSFLSCYRTSRWSQKGELLGVRLQPVVAGTVCEATSHLAASFRINLYPSPIHVSGISNLHPSTKGLLNAFANVYPPTKRQKAITPKLLRAMYQLSGAGQTALRDTPFAVIAEIAIVGFFFDTRSCEATATAKSGRTRIIEIDGVTFRDKNNCIILRSSAYLANAYRVTLAFADQKNKTKND
jgi:hypothetical protein